MIRVWCNTAPSDLHSGFRAASLLYAGLEFLSYQISYPFAPIGFVIYNPVNEFDFEPYRQANFLDWITRSSPSSFLSAVIHETVAPVDSIEQWSVANLARKFRGSAFNGMRGVKALIGKHCGAPVIPDASHHIRTAVKRLEIPEGPK